MSHVKVSKLLQNVAYITQYFRRKKKRHTRSSVGLKDTWILYTDLAKQLLLQSFITAHIVKVKEFGGKWKTDI